MSPRSYSAEAPPKSHELYAAAKVIGDRCFDQNLAFYKCKDSTPHPSKCIEEGKEVQACVHATLLEIEKKAPREFRTYADCLAWNTLKPEECRTKQLLFEAAYYSS